MTVAAMATMANGTNPGAAGSGVSRLYFNATGQPCYVGNDGVEHQITPHQNAQSVAYTTTAADTNGDILHPTADVTARTFTIDSNANVPYPIGTRLTFICEHGAGTVTIAITTDAMYLAGAGSTGSRTLAANGIATAVKVTATEWIISGTNLT